jgi:hypothetical protein
MPAITAPMMPKTIIVPPTIVMKAIVVMGVTRYLTFIFMIWSFGQVTQRLLQESDIISSLRLVR